MSVLVRKADTTDVSVVIRIVDSGDGTPETGVVFNTSGIDLWYRREGAASTDITEADLATPALTDAHADGGFLHINDGWYRLDLPDAACASGVTGVQVGGTVTGMVVLAPYIQIVAYDPFDTVRLGLTALPNAAADAAGGLPISDAGGLDLDAKLAATNEVTAARMGALTDWINGGRLDLILDIIAADTTTDIPALIAALNNLSAADVNGEVDTALGDYDAPTRAELTTDINSVLAKLLAYFQLALRKDAAIATDNATEVTAINADGGSGGGAFANTTDSQEAIRDKLTDIETDTGEIGTAGAGLTNINLPNQTMDIVGNITGNLSGSVGSVTGAVGSVTGAVGSVTGAVGSVTGDVGGVATGGIDAASFAAGAIDATALDPTAGAEIADAVWDEAVTEPSAVWAWASATPRKILSMLGAAWRNKTTQTADTYALRNDADDADIATATVSDDATTFTRGVTS